MVEKVVFVEVVIDVWLVAFVPVIIYPCWPSTGVVKLDPVHKIRWSFNVNVFALVYASETFPFKTIFPVKVGLAFGAYVKENVEVALYIVKYVLAAVADG